MGSVLLEARTLRKSAENTASLPLFFLEIEI
jgi:hypothetical protein